MYITVTQHNGMSSVIWAGAILSNTLTWSNLYVNFKLFKNSVKT